MGPVSGSVRLRERHVRPAGVYATEHAEDAGPTGPKLTTEVSTCSTTGSALLLALVERQVDDFERLGLATEVHVQGRAGRRVFDVDVGHGDRVSEGG